MLLARFIEIAAIGAALLGELRRKEFASEFGTPARPIKEKTTMKTTLVAALAALAALTAVPAFAQAPATAAANGAMSVETTTIGALWANPASKAILEKELPVLAQYIDQIKDMTLSQLAPMSQGAVDDAKLKTIQAELNQVGK